jgi:hypothetical protein
MVRDTGRACLGLLWVSKRRRNLLLIKIGFECFSGSKGYPIELPLHRVLNRCILLMDLRLNACLDNQRRLSEAVRCACCTMERHLLIILRPLVSGYRRLGQLRSLIMPRENFSIIQSLRVSLILIY